VYDRLFATRPTQDTAQVHQDTPAQQQAWEEQQAREAHERDQQNPTDEDEELKG
jgi:hypothetical protein